VVGAGNTGAETALDVVSGHPTWLSGRDTRTISGPPPALASRRRGAASLVRSRASAFRRRMRASLPAPSARPLRTTSERLAKRTPDVRSGRDAVVRAGAEFAPASAEERVSPDGSSGWMSAHGLRIVGVPAGRWRDVGADRPRVACRDVRPGPPSCSDSGGARGGRVGRSPARSLLRGVRVVEVEPVEGLTRRGERPGRRCCPVR